MGLIALDLVLIDILRNICEILCICYTTFILQCLN